MSLTEKQKKALDLLNNKDFIFYLFDGSSRSGKTYIICYWLIAYSYIFPGIDIIIARHNFSHAKATIWKQTLLPLLRSSFKGYYTENKSECIITMDWGSTIYLGGLEEGDRLDKILGSEFALIYVNEATEIAFSTFQTLISRLNSKIADVKFCMDCNPRSPSHWLNRYFIQKMNPETREPLSEKEIKRICRQYFHVLDNQDNLSDTYIEILSNLTGLKRKRFLDGVWSDATEGGVFRFKREINCVDEPIKYVEGAKIWTGWDFGIADNVFIIWCQYIPVPKTEENKLGVEIQVIDEYFNNNQDYLYYAQIVKDKSYQNVRHAGDPSGVQRNASLQSWIGLLRSVGISIAFKNGLTVADYVSNANMYMPAIRVCENQCPKTVEMFENWTYPKDKEGKVKEGKLPEHNSYSHPGTAFYYQIANVYPPRKNQLILPKG